MLTDSRIFEIPVRCTGCGLDLAQYDENTSASSCPHEEFQPANVRHFLPDAEQVADIHLARSPAGAIADIPQRFILHSPDGFEWGYGGSGPADLALNVLGLFVPPPEAWRLHQDYKWFAIAGLSSHGPHTITAASVRAWIKEQWKKPEA